MKKVLALALAALCVSAAQALTLTWEKEIENTTTAASNRHGGTGVYANRSLTIGAAITYGSSLGTGAVLSFGKTGADRFAITIDADGKYGFTQSGTAAATANVVTAVAGESQIVTLSLYRDTGTNMQKIEAAVNGTVIGLFENTSIVAGPWEYVEWGREVGGTNAYTESATYTVYSSFANGNGALVDATTAYNDIKEITGVPEPTALALLALGVAGLALKRKNA